MSYQQRAPLTVAAAIEIQKQQLDVWRAKLHPVVYAALEAECQRQNSLLQSNNPPSDGYDVWRGQSMDCFVMNFATSKPEAATLTAEEEVRQFIAQVKSMPYEHAQHYVRRFIDRIIGLTSSAKDNRAHDRLHSALVELAAEKRSDWTLDSLVAAIGARIFALEAALEPFMEVKREHCDGQIGWRDPARGNAIAGDMLAKHVIAAEKALRRKS